MRLSSTSNFKLVCSYQYPWHGPKYQSHTTIICYICLLQESWILHAQIHPVKKGWHLKNGHFIQLSVLLSKCIKERSYIASTIMMCVWKDDILWKCEEWHKTNKSFGIIKKCSSMFHFQPFILLFILTWRLHHFLTILQQQ